MGRGEHIRKEGEQKEVFSRLLLVSAKIEKKLRKPFIADHKSSPPPFLQEAFVV